MARNPTLISLTVALLVVSGVFWLLERYRPSLPDQRRARGDTRLDLIYWFFTPLVTSAATRLTVAVVFIAFAASQGLTLEELLHLAGTRRTLATSLPLWVQVPLALFLADLLGYWSHRLFHGRGLWRFHAVHHSSRTLDWLSSVRFHPVNDAATRVAQALPLYWLGFDGAVLVAFVPFLTFHGLLLHANVRWDFGPLRYVVASPTFHRWHHTSEAEGLDTNFAGLFPFIDLAFGTFYMPLGREPQHFGLAGSDAVPAGLFGQLAYPFRSHAPRPAETPRAT